MLRTVEGLARRGWHVSLVVRDQELFESRRTDPGAPVRIIQLPFSGDYDPRSIMSVARMGRRANVIYVSTRRDYTIGGIAGRLIGKPVLLRLGSERRLRDRFRDRLRYGRLPSALLVNAAGTKRVLRETAWMRDVPIHVVYNGVDSPGRPTPRARAEVRTSLGIQERDLLVVGAGRLDAGKRWDWLIDATADLVSRGHDVQTVLLGSGAARVALEARVAERQIGGRFRFAGYRTDAADCLGAADVSAHPSLVEGVPGSVLEALGRGVATIATAAGGLPEILESGSDALLCDIDSYDQFVLGLERLVSEPDLRGRLGDGGLRRMREGHSWDHMLNRLEDVFASLDGTG